MTHSVENRAETPPKPTPGVISVREVSRRRPIVVG
jgi:hypothetical protein